MKLTESTDPCSSDRTFMGNEGFLQMFIWRMDCSQKKKKTYCLANLVLIEGKTDFCYSVPTLANPWTYGQKS